MYTYNPLKCPEIISIIAEYLSESDLLRYLDINQVWYNSIRYKLFKRLDKYRVEYKRLESEMERERKKGLTDLFFKLSHKREKIWDYIFWIECNQNDFCKPFEWIPGW